MTEGSRSAAAGASEKDLLSDLEFLSRLWKRVQHQATEALTPEVIYTVLVLARRFRRDVFAKGIKRPVVVDKSNYDTQGS